MFSRCYSAWEIDRQEGVWADHRGALPPKKPETDNGDCGGLLHEKGVCGRVRIYGKVVGVKLGEKGKQTWALPS